MCYKTKEREIISLHSKLKTKKWPSLTNIINQILAHIPQVELSVQVFDREAGFEEEQDSKVDKRLISSKVEGIEINLFRLRQEKIEHIYEDLSEQIDTINNPKKRIYKIMESKINMMTQNPNSIKRPISTRVPSSRISRPMTAKPLERLINKIVG